MSNFGHLIIAFILVFGQLIIPSAAMSVLPSQPKFQNLLPIQVVARSTRKKMSPQLEKIRKRLIARRTVSTPDLRRLADAGDSLASYAFAKRLTATDNPRLASDAVHYYSISALGGRGYAVRPILELLSRVDTVLKPSHMKHAERALKYHALRGQTAAVDGLIQLYSAGTPFGMKPDEIARLLDLRIKKGDGDAAYRLAIEKLSTPERKPEDTAAAIAYLKIAAETGTFGVRASAVNLISLLSSDSALPTGLEPTP